MGWEDIFKKAASILQKPQSVTSSMLGEITGRFDDDRAFVDQFESGTVDFNEETAARYEQAKANVGDTERSNSDLNALLNPEALVRAAAFGLGNNVTPSDISGVDDASNAGKAYNAMLNLTLDPSWASGGLTKLLPAGSKVGNLATAATTFGKLEDATKAERAAQLARRLGQGAIATVGSADLVGNPLAAVGIASGIGAAERYIPRVAAKLMSQGNVNTSGLGVVDEVVGADKLVSMPAIERVKIMGELNPAPGFGIEQPPIGGFNPRPPAVPMFDDSLEALLEGASRRTVDQGIRPITVRDPLPGLDEARRLSREMPSVDPVTLAKAMGLQGRANLPEQIMAKKLLQQLQIEGSVGRPIGETRIQTPLGFNPKQDPYVMQAIARESLPKPEVPMFEDSLEQLVGPLKRGMPVLPRQPLALNPAPTVTPLNVLSPTSEQEAMAQIQDLISQLQDPRRRALVLGQLRGS